jgi:hypothetical protein
MQAKEKLLLRQVARELMNGLEEGADVRGLNIPDVEGVSRECIEALFKAASPGGKGVVAHFKEYNFDPDWGAQVTTALMGERGTRGARSCQKYNQEFQLSRRHS